jgi:hypothetical protein
MSKEVIIEDDFGRDYLVSNAHTGEIVKADFKTESEAKKWAKENGYKDVSDRYDLFAKGGGVDSKVTPTRISVYYYNFDDEESSDDWRFDTILNGGLLDEYSDLEYLIEEGLVKEKNVVVETENDWNVVDEAYKKLGSYGDDNIQIIGFYVADNNPYGFRNKLPYEEEYAKGGEVMSRGDYASLKSEFHKKRDDLLKENPSYKYSDYEGYIAIDESDERIGDWEFYGEPMSYENWNKVIEMYPNAKAISFSERINSEEDGHPIDYISVEYYPNSKGSTYAKGGEVDGQNFRSAVIFAKDDIEENDYTYIQDINLMEGLQDPVNRLYKASQKLGIYDEDTWQEAYEVAFEELGMPDAYAKGGGVEQSSVYDIDGVEYLVSEPTQNPNGEYSGWTCYKAVFETKNGEKHLNYEKTKTMGNKKWLSNEDIMKGQIVKDYFAKGGMVKKNDFTMLGAGLLIGGLFAFLKK